MLPKERLPPKMLIFPLGRFPAHALLHVAVATLLAMSQLAGLKLAQVKQNKLWWQPAAAVSAYSLSESSLALQLICTQYSLFQVTRLHNSTHLILLIFLYKQCLNIPISIALIRPFSSLSAHLGTWILIHYSIFIYKNKQTNKPSNY